MCPHMPQHQATVVTQQHHSLLLHLLQEFFIKDMGLPLTMKPNYEDFSCQYAPPVLGGRGGEAMGAVSCKGWTELSTSQPAKVDCARVHCGV